MYHKNQPNVGYMSMWVNTPLMNGAWVWHTQFHLSEPQFHSLSSNPTTSRKLPPAPWHHIPGHPIPNSLTPSSGSQRPQIRRFFFQNWTPSSPRLIHGETFRRKNQPFSGCFCWGGWYFILEWFLEPKTSVYIYVYIYIVSPPKKAEVL